jgi:LysR family hydrogen peroxide-inducible transcriptional activator
MSQPTIQQLTYLVALADEGSFSGAADACFISQPALSAQIKGLEIRLGQQLVERTPRGILLTHQGAQVVERARALMRDMNDLVIEAHSDGDELRRDFHISAIPTMAPYLLPALVKSFRTHHPHSQLHLHEEQTHDLVQSLRHGNIDLGLLALPIDEPTLTSVVLANDPFLVAMSSDHKWANTTSPISLDRLAKENILLLEQGHCLRDQAENLCIRSNIKPSDFQATSLPTLVQMVAANMGITLLPQSAAPIEAREGSGVITRPLRSSSAGRSIGLIWRTSSPISKSLAPIISDLSKLWK